MRADRALATRKNEVLELATELIAYETVSPVETVESYRPIIELLEAHGIEYQIHDFNGVKNLTAEIGNGDSSICLNGHLDVVEAGTGWTRTGPFDPIVTDGKLYGRGAADMKSGVAAMTWAFIDLHQDPDFDGHVVLMVVGDEEIGGEQGTNRLVEEYYD